MRANVAAGTTLKREGRAEEVAYLVAYLASDQSRFLAGNSVDDVDVDSGELPEALDFR